MTEFSDRDLDRKWRADEVKTLTDRDLIRLAFQRDRKNILFFMPLAIVFYVVARYFGTIGQIIGWLGVLIFGAFTLYNIVVFLTGIFVLATSWNVRNEPTGKASIRWRALGVLLSAANLVLYAAFSFVAYAGVSRLGA
jgi:glycopeptide antibiotics resistance protein